MDKQLVIKLPDENTPGFFGFIKKLSVFSAVMSDPAKHSPDEIDTAVEFLLTMVSEPKDRRKARQLLDSLSAKELGAALGSVSGVPTPDPLP